MVSQLRWDGGTCVAEQPLEIITSRRESTASKTSHLGALKNASHSSTAYGAIRAHLLDPPYGRPQLLRSILAPRHPGPLACRDVTVTESPESTPVQLTPDLIDQAVVVYRTAWQEADSLMELDPDPPDDGSVDPRDRFAMLSLWSWAAKT